MCVSVCLSVFSFRTLRAGTTWGFAMRGASVCRGVWERLSDVTSSQRLWGMSPPGRGCRPSFPWRQQVQTQVNASRVLPLSSVPCDREEGGSSSWLPFHFLHLFKPLLCHWAWIPCLRASVSSSLKMKVLIVPYSFACKV